MIAVESEKISRPTERMSEQREKYHLIQDCQQLKSKTIKALNRK